MHTTLFAGHGEHIGQRCHGLSPISHLPLYDVQEVFGPERGRRDQRGLPGLRRRKIGESPPFSQSSHLTALYVPFLGREWVHKSTRVARGHDEPRREAERGRD